MEQVLACGITVKNFQSTGSTFPVDFKQKKKISTLIKGVNLKEK